MVGVEARKNGLDCQGVYQRVAGYSPGDMEERSEFPFTLFLRQGRDGWLAVTGFSTATTFGDVTARRR
jgi:hypothetical protein